MMRDESWDTPIPTKIEPSDYHAKAIVEAQKEFSKYSNMPLKQAEILSKKSYQKELRYYAIYNKKNASLKRKYEAMLAKVNKWTPPTPDHENLKKFMIEQIESSIKFDCENNIVQKNGLILN